MSLAALTGLMNGVADSLNDKKDRKEREADRILREREIDALESGGGYRPRGGERAASNGVGTGRSGGYGRPSRGQGGSGGLQGLIDSVEGGGNFDTLFGHSQGEGGRYSNVRVSEMTLGQLYDFSSPSGDYAQWVKSKVGRVATPMGRNQIVGTTLRATAKEMGLGPDTVYSRRVQTDMFEHLANNRLRGQKTASGRRAAMRAEWDGFKHVNDADLDAAIARFQGRAASAPAPAQDNAQEQPIKATTPAELGPRIAAEGGLSRPKTWNWLNEHSNGATS